MPLLQGRGSQWLERVVVVGGDESTFSDKGQQSGGVTDTVGLGQDVERLVRVVVLQVSTKGRQASEALVLPAARTAVGQVKRGHSVQ